MTVHICRLYKAFEQYCWLCDDCAEAKRQDGYDISVGEPIEQPCDLCRKGGKDKAA